MNQTQEQILLKIADGYNNSRKLADELGRNQEYLRRVIKTLENKGKIKIIKEPRGHTYEIV